MKLRATAPAPWTVDVESTVSERLYGERREVRATPIRRGTPTALGARYRLLERLGSGGTADVYRAQDERLRRDVAVKVVAERLAHDPATVRRFHREAELCARLAHRNVAVVLDAGSRPRDYIVMELVDGQDAATLLEQDQMLTISDLFSLGVVAYRLLGGPPPFRRCGREDTAARPSAIASLPSLAEVRRRCSGSAPRAGRRARQRGQGVGLARLLCGGWPAAVLGVGAWRRAPGRATV